MRHGKDTVKLGRTSAHRDSMFVNMLKSLIMHGRISTTLVKAKELKRRADHLIAIAKNSDAETACKNKKKIKTPVAARRQAIAALRICYNPLTASEAKEVKANDTSSYSTDRLVINKLFGELRTRFKQRDGGYTRIIRTKDRVGDSAPLCLIEYVE